MNNKAFQDLYPEDLSHCYGCGRLNAHGHQIKSHWEEVGVTTIAHFTPQPYHTAIPGYVYGGLIASLIDCHGTGTAAAAAYHAEGRAMDTAPVHRFVTGGLNVRYHKPTPMGVELVLRGKVREIKGRKITVDIQLSANGVVTATGEVIAFEAPEEMLRVS